jgi:single-strand selective monofunctional uracil DNA glycosylase
MDVSEQLVDAARTLANAAGRLKFRAPISHVYNPLDYAWAVHERYLREFGASPKRVVFLGMNPGPFGMVQTGVPFGEVAAVRNWMALDAPVRRARREHARRPIEGFGCTRSEVSGRRLWGLFAQRFGPAAAFFAKHFVANYCPLAFFDERGRNLTPDRLPGSQTRRLFPVCDRHLREVIRALRPEWVIGVGEFAEQRARSALSGAKVKFGRILHPSPASPAANRDWAGAVLRQLETLGIW